MVATWLVELLLDQINRALLEDTAEARAAVDDYTARLRAFLKVKCASFSTCCGQEAPDPRQEAGSSGTGVHTLSFNESSSTGHSNTCTNGVLG